MLKCGPEKHKLGRIQEVLASSQLSSESVQGLQKKGIKCLSYRRGYLGIVSWVLAFRRVSSNSVKRLQRRSRKCLRQSHARAAFFFRSAPKSHTNGRGRARLLSSFIKFYLAGTEQKLKIYQLIIGQDGHFCFPIGKIQTQSWQRTLSSCFPFFGFPRVGSLLKQKVSTFVEDYEKSIPKISSKPIERYCW